MNDPNTDHAHAANFTTFGALLLAAAGWAACMFMKKLPLLDSYVHNYDRNYAVIHGPVLLLGLGLWGVAALRLASKRWRVTAAVIAILLTLALLAGFGVALFNSRRVQGSFFAVLVPVALFVLVAIGCLTDRVSRGFFKYATYFTGGALVLLMPLLFAVDRLPKTQHRESMTLFALTSVPLLLAYLSRFRWPALGWGVPALFVGCALYHGHGAIKIVADTSNLSTRSVLTVAAATLVALIALALVVLLVRELLRPPQRLSIDVEFD